jgi:hypothetical protein
LIVVSAGVGVNVGLSRFMGASLQFIVKESVR